MQENRTEHAGALFKTTLVDFPGLVACSFFLRGCNMRCPYCYNVGLVLNEDDKNLSSIAELYAHLEKRKNVLSGLVVSGGEALANSLTPEIIKEAKSLGYKIKLDTNGTLSEKLEELV
ncbi:MAG: radical SAM protein, partial [Treponema sp.]|nr:radical SAM protein [Treponema sp.]